MLPSEPPPLLPPETGGVTCQPDRNRVCPAPFSSRVSFEHWCASPDRRSLGHMFAQGHNEVGELGFSFPQWEAYLFGENSPKLKKDLKMTSQIEWKISITVPWLASQLPHTLLLLIGTFKPVHRLLSLSPRILGQMHSSSTSQSHLMQCATYRSHKPPSAHSV